jgi:hypothetical protein
MNYINNNNYHPQQDQGWNQQRPNYQGNNYNNFNQPPLRELVAGQSRLMDQLSNKIASNDKILENISTRIDNVSSAIKN